MTFGAAVQVAAVKLMNALGGDGAGFFAGQSGGNFLPRFALLALLVDKLREQFEAAVEGAPAAGAFAFGRLIVVDDFLIHQQGV